LQGEVLELIKAAAKKAMHITQELLILATVSHQEIEKKPINVNSIYTEAKNQILDLIKKHDARIFSSDGWPRAAGYAPWIEEVWMNYLTNAIKYSGKPPVIEVGADEPENGKIRFWVKDNGDGISAENQNRLFHKYVRLAPEKADGYGLGLSIVKRIVEKLGGEVGVESTGKKGEGAQFWFELPAAL
jgi:signal transduction histidine kinase